MTQNKHQIAGRILRMAMAAGFAWLVFSYWTIVRSESAAAAPGPAPTVITNSLASRNVAKYYSLRDYANMKSQANWPLRSSGCTSNGKTYKSFPWLPDNQSPYVHNDVSGSPRNYDGNVITTTGNCGDSFTDGGSAAGGWMMPSALGGWATSGSNAGFGTSYVASSSVIDCNNLRGGGAPKIWGSSASDPNEQAFGGSGLLARNGYNQSMGIYGLYGNGTTLFRNTFTLTSEQYDSIAAGSTIRLWGAADDWMRVYLNGNLLYTTISTTGVVSVSLPAGYFKPAGQSNLLAVQVSDKARWSWNNLDNAAGRGSGVCYNLTLEPPPFKLTCGGNLLTTPAEIEPSMVFTARARVDVGTSAGSPPNQSMVLTIDKLTGGQVYKSGAVVPARSGTLATSTFNPVGPLAAGKYRATWRYTSTGYNITCSSDFNVAALPYLAVYGGDVIAGASPTVNGAGKPTGCAVNNAAGVYSWNTGSPGYTGAGASYAVMALGQIKGFASTQGSPGQPTGLSFANTTNVNLANGLFGGGAGNVPATCDFISDPSLPATPTTNNNMPINSTVVNNGETVTYFNRGDVRIGGNITYGSTSWTDVSDIPKFKLVVIGDIYIDKDVTELNGIYVAIPDPSTGKGGNIYTCANGFNAVSTGMPNYYKTCDKQLKIYGAFAAKSVQFLRTFGTMSQPNQAAEQFYYSPELWLPRTINAVGSSYSSITGLPPVL